MKNIDHVLNAQYSRIEDALEYFENLLEELSKVDDLPCGIDLDFDQVLQAESAVKALKLYTQYGQVPY